MTKILIFENSSGMAHYTYKVCNGLAQFGENNSIFYMTDSDFLYKQYLSSKIKLVDTLLTFSPSVTNKLLWIINRVYVVLRNILARNKFINNNKIEVLNIQFTTPIIEQFFIKMLCKKVKVVLTVHDVVPPVKSFYWSMKSLKKIYDNCHLLVVHTEENKKQLQDLFNIPDEKIQIIHHGVDVEYHKKSKNECSKILGIPNDGITSFLFFGGIRAQKGLDDLIRAVNEIDVPCRLIIAGSMPYGESFDKYERLIKDQNKFVKHIGFIEEEKLDYYFQYVDAVVNPYKYFYSQSGVFMECIKYRKPIIASNVSSFKRFIDHYGIGIVVEPNDVNSLKNGLYKFINLPRTEIDRMILNLDIAAKDNSWESAARLYYNSFSKVYGNA